MKAVEFRSILDEVISLHGNVDVVFIGDENSSALVTVQEVEAAAVRVNGKLVFAFITASLEGNTETMQ